MINGTVGVFDSGVGGLSVAREIRRHLPAEQILYFADTAYCPYGGRPLEQIRERSLIIARELLDRGAKVIVVACNSASGAALEVLREEFTLPIVGMEPAVKPAVAATRSGRVGVLATEATLQAERFDRLTSSFASGVELFPQPCPGLVDLVEAGQTSGTRVREVLEPLLAPLQKSGVDTIVLGCTHYPFLSDAVRDVMGEGVAVVDSGDAVARQVGRVLSDQGTLAVTGEGGLTLLTTGTAAEVRIVAERLWGASVPTQSIDI
ncbi:glutamate racemase [soil metagenome]